MGAARRLSHFMISYLALSHLMVMTGNYTPCSRFLGPSAACRHSTIVLGGEIRGSQVVGDVVELQTVVRKRLEFGF